jgi:hypothetical protein
VPALTFSVSTNFALANCLASRSLGNVSVALALFRFPVAVQMRRTTCLGTYLPWEMLSPDSSLRGPMRALLAQLRDFEIAN